MPPASSLGSENQTVLNQLWLPPSSDIWMRGNGSPGAMYWLRSKKRAPWRLETSPSQ